jgi:hypothetical protein
MVASVDEREEAHFIGPLRERPICGGKCGVRRPSCVIGAERAIGCVAKIPRSRVASGTDPGLDIPLTDFAYVTFVFVGSDAGGTPVVDVCRWTSYCTVDCYCG